VGINNYADHTGFSVAWRVSAPQAYLYTWYDAATATYTFVNYDSSSGEIYAGLGYGGLPSGAFVGAPFTNLGYFSTGAYYIPGGSSSTYSYEVFYRRNYWPLVHALCFLDQEY
jgi:hypothetical protein